MSGKRFKSMLITLCCSGLVIVGIIGYVCILYHKAYNGDRESFFTLVDFGFKHFPQTRMINRDLDSVKLKFANLEGSDLSLSNLESADLESANLKFANLQRTNFILANLKSANLESAQLKFANIKATNLESANLKSADLESVSLYKANLTSVDFSDASLEKAYMRSVTLVSAKLNNCNLSRADLGGADLSMTDFSSANLSGAYLGQCQNLTPEQLSRCSYIGGICGLDQKFLEEIRKLNPKLMTWWNGQSREMTYEQWQEFLKTRTR